MRGGLPSPCGPPLGALRSSALASPGAPALFDSQTAPRRGRFVADRDCRRSEMTPSERRPELQRVSIRGIYAGAGSTLLLAFGLAAVALGYGCSSSGGGGGGTPRASGFPPAAASPLPAGSPPQD